MYLERLKLDGRRALVTGGASGIGLACVEALGEMGAAVTIADLKPDLIDAAVASLRDKGLDADGVVMDVTDSDAVTAIADRMGAIDILVNNAGIARSDTPAETVADEHWRNVLDVNLNGTFWCARAFGRHMLAAGRGSIVNVGSMSGFIVNRPQPQSYYNASKAAVHQLTKSLAAEWPTGACGSMRSRPRISARRSTSLRTRKGRWFGAGSTRRRWPDWARSRKWRRSSPSWRPTRPA